MAIACPICGSRLKEGQKLLEFSYHGRVFVLCTFECMRIFEQFPDVYGDDALPDIQLLEDLNTN